MEITTDKEFKSLIPPLTPDEYQQLETNIKQDGCQEPLSVWKNGSDILLDGHNRLAICKKHSIAYETNFLSFDSREAAKLWIGERQLDRRNLTDDQKAMVVAKLYDIQVKLSHAEKLAHARDVKKNGKSGLEAQSASKERTRKKIAKTAKLPERKVRLAARIEKRDSDAARFVRDGVLNLARGIKLANLPEDVRKVAITKS
jgi:hypothetical protein